MSDLMILNTFMTAMQRCTPLLKKEQISISIELDFHRSIAIATQNQVSIRIGLIIKELIIKTCRDISRSGNDHRHTQEEYTSIYETTLSRDFDRTYDALYNHLSACYSRTILKYNNSRTTRCLRLLIRFRLLEPVRDLAVLADTAFAWTVKRFFVTSFIQTQKRHKTTHHQYSLGISNIKQKINYVTILDDIFLAF